MKKKMAIGLVLFVAVCGIAVAAGTCISYYYRNGDSYGLTVTTESFREEGERGIIMGTNITVSSNVERRIRIKSTNFGQGTHDVFAPYAQKTYKVNKQIKSVTIEAETCD